MKQPYHEMPLLKNVYLEDSWVIGIESDQLTAKFKVEFVLTEKHESYAPPRKNEQYCYKNGILRFDNCSAINWRSVKHIRNIDIDDQMVLGNIDSYHFEDNTHYLEGDWGEVEIHSDSIKLVWL